MMPRVITLLLQQDKTPLVASALAVIGLTSLAALLSGQWFGAVGGALLAGLLAMSRHQLQAENLKDNRIARLVAIGLVAGGCLGVLADDSTLQVWWLLVPPVALSSWRFRPALGVLLAASLLLLVVSSLANPGPERHQWFAALALVATISITLTHLRNIKERQLRPLRRTDTLTQASTREHVDADLSTEIVRSEREGTDLAVIALALDAEGLANLPPPDQRAIVARTGRLLHTELRIFEAYYRIEDAGFLILLPHADTAAAMKTASRLRQKIRKTFKELDAEITASAGIASLNVGDDAVSLMRNAMAALAAARKHGNKSQSHAGLGQQEEDSHE